MLPQSALLFLSAIPTNRVGRSVAPCKRNLALGSGSASALLGYYPPPSSNSLLQYGSKLARSAQAQPSNSKFGVGVIIKITLEKFQRDCPPTKKYRDDSSRGFSFGDHCRDQNQWLVTLSTIKNSVDLTVLVVNREEDSTYNWIPTAIESTIKVFRSRVILTGKNTKLDPDIGSFSDRSDAQVRAEQSFDIATIELLVNHSRLLGVIVTPAPGERLPQNFGAEETHRSFVFGAVMSLSTSPALPIFWYLARKNLSRLKSNRSFRQLKSRRDTVLIGQLNVRSGGQPPAHSSPKRGVASKIFGESHNHFGAIAPENWDMSAHK